MKIRSAALNALRVALACLFALTGCDDSQPAHEAQDACRRGAVRACTGADACEGTRTCSATPARFGACECGDAGRPQADAGRGQELGTKCEGDEDCPRGAFCLGPGSELLFGGGAPDGTCVADCSDGAAACERFDEAVCVETSIASTEGAARTALCFEGCRLGAASAGKCHARESVACAPVGATGPSDGFCRPLCASDADCADRFCQPGSGVCVDEAVVDRDFGLRCSPGDAGDDADAGATPSAAVECVGLCVELNEAPVVCSRRCVFGNAEECAPASGGLRRGACVFATERGGIGDLGYCGELCDCSDDCIEPTFLCDAFDDAALEQAFGRKGVCTAPELITARVIDCALADR